MNAVESLLTLITPNMEDAQLMEDLEAADEEWKGELKKRKKLYELELRKAARGSPDLVEKPNTTPGIDHWKKKYMIALGLFERRGLMLKVNIEDDL